MITLLPMTRDEAQSWLAESVVDFAADLVESGGLSPDEASAKARKMLDEILPELEDTAGHEFVWVVSGDAHVGRVWFAPSVDDPTVLYIWDMAVDEEQRGQGVGGAALDAIICRARDRGMSGVGLSVFEANDAAHRLYERTGFIPIEEKGGQISMELRW
jgi:ribosomal protein S18 acetylase RimI-like enzyme